MCCFSVKASAEWRSQATRICLLADVVVPIVGRVRMRRGGCSVTLRDSGAVLEFDVALSARDSTSAEERTQLIGLLQVSESIMLLCTTKLK